MTSPILSFELNISEFVNPFGKMVNEWRESISIFEAKKYLTLNLELEIEKVE